MCGRMIKTTDEQRRLSPEDKRDRLELPEFETPQSEQSRRYKLQQKEERWLELRRKGLIPVIKV